MHGSTGQRLFEISDLCGVKCTGVELVGKTSRKEASVDVTFSDGHVSSFNPDHLARSTRNHKAWADSAGGWWLPEPKLWSSSEFAVTPFFSHDDVVERKSNMQALLGQLHSHGAVIVRGCPTTDGTIAEFGRRIGVIRDTNWGAVFEVRTNPQSEADAADAGVEGSADGDANVDLADLAYTNAPLNLHVDNPYRLPMPGYQLLHCLIAADSGGESLVADGWRAAEILREEDREAFDILREVKTRFQYQSEDTDLCTFLPCISTKLDDPDGDVNSVVYSSRLDFAPLLSADKLDVFYKARYVKESLYYSV